MSGKKYQTILEAYNSIYEQRYTVFGGNRYLEKPDGTLTFPPDGRTKPNPDELKPPQPTTTAPPAAAAPAKPAAPTPVTAKPAPTGQTVISVKNVAGQQQKVTVGRQYAATQGGVQGNVTYDASGKKTFTPNTAATPAATPTPTPPPAPRTTLNDPADLDALRKASAQATMAGPSREAQALMSDRTKRMLGPEKLKAGIEGQERVEKMKSQIGMPKVDPPKPAATPTAPTGGASRDGGATGVKPVGTSLTGGINPVPGAPPSDAKFSVATPATPAAATPPRQSLAAQAAELRDMQKASQMRQQGANVMGSNITSVRQSLDAARARDNAPAPAGTALATQQQKQAMQNLKKPSPNLKMSLDLFDIVKGHLLDEGYADNEDAALAIMANMSEDWKQSIVEAQEARNNPEEYERKEAKKKSKKQRAMEDPHTGINSPAFEKFMRQQMGR